MSLAQNAQPTLHFEQEEQHLPLIDFSHFRSQQDRGLAMLALREAAEKWGCFRLVSHGIPDDILRSIETPALRFFSLPSEQKNKGSGHLPPPYGYVHYEDEEKCREFIQVHTQRAVSELKEVLEKVFQEQEDKFIGFCVDAAKYVQVASELLHQLREFLTECLGLIPSYFTELYSEGEQDSVLRFNYHPGHPQPKSLVGLGSHTDPGSLTIVHQDPMGGLQVLKDDNWVHVQPQTGSLIVLLGYCFQVLSNGQFKGVHHRVVLNEDVPRFSIVFFYNCNMNALIQPAKEVIVKDGQAKYKAQSWKQYITHFIESKEDAMRSFEIQCEGQGPNMIAT